MISQSHGNKTHWDSLQRLFKHALAWSLTAPLHGYRYDKRLIYRPICERGAALARQCIEHWVVSHASITFTRYRTGMPASRYTDVLWWCDILWLVTEASNKRSLYSGSHVHCQAMLHCGTIQYDTIRQYLTCDQKLTCSQLSLPHDIKMKTNSSAIADRPRCMVGELWPEVEDWNCGTVHAFDRRTDRQTDRQLSPD